MNEFVQDTFYDTRFGATREEVVQNFTAHGFSYDKAVSNEGILLFYPTDKLYFTFGNRNWQIINVQFYNNKFSAILFYDPQKEKFSAETKYKNILSEVKSKYKMTESAISDTTTYARNVGLGKNKCNITVEYKMYETVGHEKMYSAYLIYTNDSISSEPSNEL